MSATNPFVHVDNVAKRWNGQLGVGNISLSIPRGSFVALDVQALDLLSLVVQPDTVEVGPVSPDDITSPRRAAGAAMGQA